MKALIAGHISIDLRDGKEMLGGPPLYQIPVLEALGYDIDVLTSYNEEQINLRKLYPRVRFIVKKSEYTTTYQFLNIESDRKGDPDRELILKSKASDINIDDIEELDSVYDVIIVSPIAQEFNFEVLDQLARRGRSTFFDMQGTARKFGIDGKVYEKLNYDDYRFILRRFKTVKASKSELNNLKVIDPLFNTEFSLLIVTDNGNEIKASTRSITRTIKIDRTTEIVDSTGSGDIFLAIIAGLDYKMSPRKSIKHAHEIAKLNLMTAGIPTTNLIRNQLKSLNLISE